MTTKKVATTKDTVAIANYSYKIIPMKDATNSYIASYTTKMNKNS